MPATHPKLTTNIGYVQGKQLERPIFTDEGPVDITVNGLTESRWRCYCSFPWIEVQFPHVGQGFEEGEEPPAFKVKKVKTKRGPPLPLFTHSSQNAKQFAAQQALDFLEKYEAGAREDSVAASPPRQPLFEIKTEDTSPSRAGLGQQAPRRNGNNNNNDDGGDDSASDDGGSGIGNKGNAPSIYECVARLATRLALDQPAYRIERDRNLPHFYRGWAEFKPGSRVPDNLGSVQGVLGKTEAKVQVAENVLVWLQNELQRRQDVINTVPGWAKLGSR